MRKYRLLLPLVLSLAFAAKAQITYEDFEAGQQLLWQPLDQNAVIHGSFAGPVANPLPNGVNASQSVGCYSKGVSPFSILQVVSPSVFDVSVHPQLKLDVLSPAGGGLVTMQLFSLAQGTKEFTALVKTPGEWETLLFDFSGNGDIPDFSEIRLIFNAGTAAAGESWCLDNLRQSEITVDPCLGTVPVPTIVDDFECQRNYASIFFGASDLQPVANPHADAANGSLRVGQYIDPPNEAWAGIGFNFGAAPNLLIFNQLELLVWAPASAANTPVLLKLEGGSSGEIQKWVNISETEKWTSIRADFSDAIGSNNPKLVIFFNAGNDAPSETYFVDNFRWARLGATGCIDDHETPQTTVSNFKYFANGHLETSGYQFEVVDNPNKSGINLSGKVGKFVKASNAASFAGMYTDLPVPLDWKGLEQIRAKVLMTHIGNFAVKIEGDAVNGFSLEIPKANTKTGEWEELVFDFSAAPDNSEFDRLTIFFDLGIAATGQNVTSFFDEIEIGNGGDCTQTSLVFNPIPLVPIRVWPNPASDFLKVENSGQVFRLDVLNALGQRVVSQQTNGEWRSEIDLTRFVSGVYVLVGFDSLGVLLGNALFFKQ